MPAWAPLTLMSSMGRPLRYCAGESRLDESSAIRNDFNSVRIHRTVWFVRNSLYKDPKGFGAFRYREVRPSFREPFDRVSSFSKIWLRALLRELRLDYA